MSLLKDDASYTAPGEYLELAVVACIPPIYGSDVADGDEAIGIDA